MCGLINSRVPAPGVWLLEHVVDSDRSPCEAYPVLAEAIGGHLVTEWNRRPANRPRESRGRADRLLYSDYHVEVEGPFPSGVLTGRLSGRSPATDAAGRHSASRRSPCDTAAAEAVALPVLSALARARGAAPQFVRESPGRHRQRGDGSCFLRSAFSEHGCLGERLTIWTASRARVKSEMVCRPSPRAARRALGRS